MLVLDIPETELFDEENDKFVYIRKQTIKLEHSLISISKWESKWQKPFLSKEKKTREEILDYIRCMFLTPSQDKNVILGLSVDDINKIIEYIDSPMTATTVTFFDNKPKTKEETVTSELIYYWMITAGIPFECEKWHINRLFALLKICSAKNAPKKKATKEMMNSQAALNAKRRAAMKSKG